MSPKLPTKLVVTVNSTGRQAASFIRVASAVGWRVRAQFREDDDNPTVRELHELSGVECVRGDLEDKDLISRLFRGADAAFINTTHWGDEVVIGKALADAARIAGIQHYVYSSMPDHASFNKGWRSLPLWAQKYEIEKYIRSMTDLPATFVYTGVYNNNFTSLPFPLFRLEMQPDHSWVWQAPFPPDAVMPWLDVEHDIGPALLQIFKEGPHRWSGHRIPLAFEVLSPRDACKALSRGLGNPVVYRQGPIQYDVAVPQGYREHLEALEEVLGKQAAPYYGPTMYYPHEAIELWEGNRGLEEYAREVFPTEESNNGMTWMDDDDEMERDGDEHGDTASNGAPSSTPTTVRDDHELNFTEGL